MPNGQIAEAIADMAKKIADLQTRVNNIENTRSVTFTTPPTADGTGLPGFVVLDTKPETEYKIMFTFIRGIENECNLQ